MPETPLRHLRVVAHVLSLSRVAIGVLVLLSLVGSVHLPGVAVIALFVAGALTDWADGGLARRGARHSASPRAAGHPPAPSAAARMHGELGKWLDAGSDVLFFAAILIGLAAAGTLATWVLAPFLARELLMYGMLRPLLVRHGLDAGARAAGKAKTVLQFTVTALGLLLHLAVRQGTVTPALAHTVTTASLGVAVAASVLSLVWYWRPLAEEWPPALRRLLQQAGVTLFALLVVQVATWLLVSGGRDLDQSFALAITLWMTIAAAGLVWRRDDFKLLAGESADGWLPRLALPNVMTLFRFSSIPTLTLLLAVGPRHGGGWLLLTFAGFVFASDLFDGRLARGWGMTSRIGKILDSASDYAALFAIAGLLAWMGAVPFWLWVLVSLRLVLNASATLVIVGRMGSDAAAPTWWGKLSVAALMVYFSLELLWQVVVAPVWVVAGMVWVERAVGAVLLISLADKARYVTRTFRSRRSAGHRRSAATAGRSAERGHV